MQELRLSARGSECATAQVSTLRERFLKLGVWVERSVRRIVLHLLQSFPYLCWLRIARSVGAVPAQPTPRFLALHSSSSLGEELARPQRTNAGINQWLCT
jgi:hypothetical protein